MLKIVTFATPNYEPIYRQYIRTSIEELNLNEYHSHHIVDKVLGFGWAQRTNLKPGVILSELEKGNDVLYVDADAEITKRIVVDIGSIVPKEYIGACVFLDWDKWAGGNTGKQEPLTGTLFFRPSAIPLIEDWCNAAVNALDPDGVTFAGFVDFNRKDIFHLGIEWCFINTMPNGGKGGIECLHPLIIQHQSSRRMRCLSVG